MRNPHHCNSTHASTGVKQHAQDLCLKQRLRKGLSKRESLVKWQRSSQETQHTHWEETSLEAAGPKLHTAVFPTPHSSVTLLTQQQNGKKANIGKNMSKPTNTERKSRRREWEVSVQTGISCRLNPKLLYCRRPELCYHRSFLGGRMRSNHEEFQDLEHQFLGFLLASGAALDEPCGSFPAWNILWYLRSAQPFSSWQFQRQSCKFREQTAPKAGPHNRQHIPCAIIQPQFSMEDFDFLIRGIRSCTSDGVQPRLVLWRLLGDSSSCWRKGQGEEPSQPSHPCPTHRAVLQVHCFGQEINSNGCLERGEGLGAVTCPPASPFCTNSQKHSQACYKAGEVICLQLPSTEVIKTKQSGDLNQLHLTASFNTSQLHKNLWVWILTSDTPVSPHRLYLSWQLLLACPNSVW